MLDALTHKAFDNNPMPVNLMLLLLALVVGISLVIFVYRRSRQLGKKDLRAEAEGAEERLMPGAEVNGIDWGSPRGSDSGRDRGYGTIDRSTSPGGSPRG